MKTKEVPFLLKPPRTIKQVMELMNEHNGMFGICVLCGTAGHVDQLIEVGDDEGRPPAPGAERISLEVCGECYEKIP